MLNSTNIICDETEMDAGKIEKNGVQNVRSLSSLVQDQKMIYDFKYTSHEFPISASVLILSERQSIIKTALHVPADCDDKQMQFVMTDYKMQ